MHQIDTEFCFGVGLGLREKTSRVPMRIYYTVKAAPSGPRIDEMRFQLQFANKWLDVKGNEWLADLAATWIDQDRRMQAAMLENRRS